MNKDERQQHHTEGKLKNEEKEPSFSHGWSLDIIFILMAITFNTSASKVVSSTSITAATLTALRQAAAVNERGVTAARKAGVSLCPADTRIDEVFTLERRALGAMEVPRQTTC